jgi:hypothetical protein
LSGSVTREDDRLFEVARKSLRLSEEKWIDLSEPLALFSEISVRNPHLAPPHYFRSLIFFLSYCSQVNSSVGSLTKRTKLFTRLSGYLIVATEEIRKAISLDQGMGSIIFLVESLPRMLFSWNAFAEVLSANTASNHRLNVMIEEGFFFFRICQTSIGTCCCLASGIPRCKVRIGLSVGVFGRKG